MASMNLKGRREEIKKNIIINKLRHQEAHVLSQIEEDNCTSNDTVERGF